jgi:hypothetical protein
MSLENANYIPDLVVTNPEGTDPKSQGDDHIRLLKHVLRLQFPNFIGAPVTINETTLNSMLVAGAFGLGGPAIPFVDPNLIPAGGGFYMYSGGGPNVPPGAAGGDTLIQISTTANSTTQEWHALNGNLFTREASPVNWSVWKKLVNGEKQTTPMDATAGSILLTGAGGLLAPGSASAALNIDAPPGVTFCYGRVAGTTGTFPPGGNTGDMLLSVAFSVSAVAQLYFCLTSKLLWSRFVLNAVPSAWDCVNPLGVAQTWQNLTASRALNTSYTNSTGRAIQVSVTGVGNANADAWIEAQVGAVFVGRQGVSDYHTDAYTQAFKGCLSFVVPPGATYAVLSSTALVAVNQWSELR